jgi:GntR family transcriptional repressor for pyruvate dehydrogenase complex
MKAGSLVPANQLFAAPKTEKVSERIIEQIRDAVLSGRMKPGDRLASEGELIAQFEVSKATMREALRVLEAMGLVEIRKGTQGGVFVAEVDMKTTVHSILNFLHFRSVSVRDITMLRFMIEPSVAHLAALVRSQEDIERLGELLAEGHGVQAQDVGKEISFHRYLARMIGNPMLILIMDFLDNLLRDLKEQLRLAEDFYRQVEDSHRRILECLIAEDCVGARREMAADLLAVGDYMSAATDTPRFDPAILGFSRAALYQGGDGVSDPQGLGRALTKALARGGVGAEAAQNGLVLQRVDNGELYLLVREGEPEK